MKIKLLLISNMYPSKSHPTYGTFVKNFKTQLEQRNVDISKTVLIEGRGKTLYEKIQKYKNFFKNSIALIKQGNYDLIYVHFVLHSLLPLLFVHKKHTCPLVLNAHGSDLLPTSKLGRIVQQFVSPVIKQADMLVAPSEYFKDIMCEKFNINSEKIFISPSGGVNTNLFKPNNSQKEKKNFIIGFVSRIDEGKGWDLLVKAVALLIEENVNNFEVLIIGGGSQEKQLHNMVNSLNIKKNVRCLGAVEHTKLVSYYNKMDVFVFPTELQESLGLVGLEAMACGVPVVGSEIGGLKSYIVEGLNGEFFKVGDYCQLAERLKNFIFMSDDELNTYRMNARKTAERFDAKVVSERLFNKLRELCKDFLN